MGLDKIGLEIVSRGDDHIAAAYASKIIPVRANGNLLLCTLLLGKW
jgi:metal transporter CNNM